MPRLIFVNRFFHPDVSATSQILSDAAFYLSGKGHDVHIVTSRLAYDTADTFAAEETIEGVQVHRIWTTRFGRGNLLGRAFDYLTFYVSVYFRLRRMLAADDTVIAKTDPPMVSIVVNWAAGASGARKINWLQDLFPEVAIALGVRQMRFTSWILTALRDLSLIEADRNIVIGDNMRSKLLRLGVFSERISLVPNWADSEAIQPADCAPPLRAEWGLGDTFVIGYSGNLGRAHEIETVLGAISAMQGEAVTFVFIGGGALMTELQQKVESAGLEQCCFKPYQPRELLPQTLTLPDAHLVILPGNLEGLIVPSKIYGVLAAGKPTLYIGDPDGELANLIRDSQAGLVVREGDINGLVSAIRQLQDDTSCRQAMGANARRLLDEQFSTRTSLERLEKALTA